MNKNIKYLTIVGAVLICSLATYGVASDVKHFIKVPAAEEYELVFDKNTKPDKNDLPAAPENFETPENISRYYSGAFGYMPVTTKLGYNDLKFFYEGGFHNPNGFITLGFNGEFGNSFLKNSVNHGRINGLSRLNITYTGEPLIVNYGYESEMEHREYRVTSVPIKSGEDYLFDGNHPQYFSIMAGQIGLTQIEKIKLDYSCNQDEEKLPEENFYTSGYQIGAVHAETEIFKGKANDIKEAHRLLDRATAEHYHQADIEFNFDNNESFYDFTNLRRNFSHVFPTEIKYETGLNKTNSFLIMYEGSSTFNYDELMFEGFKSNDLALYSHKHVAQINSITSEKYVTLPLTNGNIALRQNYAKVNNLYRDPNYDEFPINSISETFDVYNSEDLWWAVSNGYRPTFPLKNSKAEWIYNEAKHILNTIIYDGMTDYEKARAIYEWIITENDYDSDAITSCRPIEENICFFLEGVFERRRGVCDSFSKTYVLLGKIEGIDVIRGCGFTHPTVESGEMSSGHAWAYFRYPGEQQYRLVCPTWGNQVIRLEGFDKRLKFVDYNAFMASRTYFTDNGLQFDFIDGNQDDDILSNEPWTKNVYTLDKVPEQDAYDYKIDTLQELTFVLTEVNKVCGQENVVLQFDLQVEITGEQMKECLISSGFSPKNHSIYHFDLKLGVFDLFLMQKRKAA